MFIMIRLGTYISKTDLHITFITYIVGKRRERETASIMGNVGKRRLLTLWETSGEHFMTLIVKKIVAVDCSSLPVSAVGESCFQNAERPRR